VANLPERDRKRSEQSEVEEQRKHEEESLDKTIEDSFPASDPPSSIPDPDEDEENAASPPFGREFLTYL
jgi:hypothetical protein